MADTEVVDKVILEGAGWKLEQVFAGGEAGHFWSVYEGGDFEHPERGILAVLAFAEVDTGVVGRRSAQVVARGFAEGYFGARKTLGPKRAVGVALEAMNSWLFAQVRARGEEQIFVPVNVTALVAAGAQVGIAHVGAGRVYRRRGDEILKFSRDHVRCGMDGRLRVTRAVGLDAEFSVDFDDEAAEVGDEYWLAGGMGGDGIEGVRAAFAAPGEKAGGGNAVPPGAGILLRVLARPAVGVMAALGDMAALPVRAPPKEGDVWDGFVIGKTIYRGRYTLLKAARDVWENRDVALKIPLPSMLQDEVFAAGFMREAWIGTTIRGENIARYIDLPAERRSSLYLVMPFYAGETLEARLGRAPVVSLPDGVGIALKLCEAVMDLAAIQVIHRDIKPDNILLLPGNKVKLIDLGLAYLPGIDLADAVKPGGTLRYMAPELLKGVQANGRTEVFALGVTVYRMFAGGAFPFGQREGVPLRRMRPDLPGWLGGIVGRAIEEDAAKRFADAGELAAALQEGLVSGVVDDALADWRFWGLSPLQVWQVAAVGFGIGFVGMLLRLLAK